MSSAYGEALVAANKTTDEELTLFLKRYLCLYQTIRSQQWR
jgi:hypothetical protein